MSRECRKCKKVIPYIKKIDGKARNLQNRKFCLGCSPFGSRNTKSDDPSRPSVRPGGKHRTYSDWTEEAKEDHRARLYWKAKNRKEFLVELKGGQCQECGYKGSSRCMTFHHRDPSAKCFNMDKRTIQTKSKEIVLEELSKCDLFCIRCHMELEDSLTNSRYENYEEKYSHLGKWE